MRKGAKGVFAAADLLLPRMPGPRLLIYHELTPHPTRQMDLTPQLFERQVEWLVGHGRIVGLETALERVGDPGASGNFVLTFDDGHRGLATFGLPILSAMSIPFTLYVTSGLIGSSDAYLTWDDVGEITATGLVTIAAHTHTHPDLRGLRVDEIAAELDISNELIESRTGVTPRHFAYPKGYWAEAAEPLVKERYDTAVLGGGPPIDGGSDPYRLSRVPVQSSDGYYFFTRKVARGMRAEEWARARLKGYENPAA